MQSLSRSRFLTQLLLHVERTQVHEHEYPYTSGKSGRTGECERRLVRPTYIRAEIEKGVTVGKRDEKVMQKYVASQGPLSICVNAEKWQHYKYDTLDLTQCPDKKTDHCVQIVGFKADDPEDSHWIVRSREPTSTVLTTTECNG